MKLKWVIEAKDIKTVKALVDSTRDHPMVIVRHQRNLANERPAISRARFWQALVVSLLTTQQRSGPNSAVARFANQRPFPLGYEVSRRHSAPERHFAQTLARFGGIRRYRTVTTELVTNLSRLENGLWTDVQKQLERLRNATTRTVEMDVADFMDDELAGFGPKQARNLLQGLGLTRYEIPVDSRITKWLNKNGFPVQLGSVGLADRNYYHFVMDGVCELCEASGAYPCILDAAIFSSFDGEGWTEKNSAW